MRLVVRIVAIGVGLLVGKRTLDFRFKLTVGRLLNVGSSILEIEASLLFDCVTKIENEPRKESTPLPGCPLYEAVPYPDGIIVT